MASSKAVVDQCVLIEQFADRNNESADVVAILGYATARNTEPRLKARAQAAMITHLLGRVQALEMRNAAKAKAKVKK